MVENKEKKTSGIVWKIYYWLMILLSIVIVGGLVAVEIIEPETLNAQFSDKHILSTLYNVIFALMFFVSLVGLRGFIYDKKYFTKEFWTFIFMVILVDYIGNKIYGYNDPERIGQILEAFITVPILYALYKYTFKMNYLWSIDHD